MSGMAIAALGLCGFVALLVIAWREEERWRVGIQHMRQRAKMGEDMDDRAEDAEMAMTKLRDGMVVRLILTERERRALHEFIKSRGKRPAREVIDGTVSGLVVAGLVSLGVIDADEVGHDEE